MADLQNLFFRVRENGAAVYRVDAENRQRRLDMQQIAVVNIRSGEVKPHGDQIPTAAERNEIDAWVVARRKIIEERRIDDLLRTTDHLNLTAQWVQTRATDEQIEMFADDLLMAMHDLRTVIVRRKADGLAKK
ncbi:MAG: hypothetical protein GYB24_06125 [Rhodobacteraceae bacterium]|nr:hypothetical protein [Paracoccaceae bacterium]